MATIRRGDQTTTDQWLGRKPGASGLPEVMPTIGRIVWYRSALIANTGVSEGKEVPAMITEVLSGGNVRLTIFRVGMAPMPSPAGVPYNDDLSRRHQGAWRWPVLDNSGVKNTG